MSETPTTKIRQTASHTFYRTPYVCDKGTTSETREECEKLEPLIRWLKNNTNSHLQQSTHNQKTQNRHIEIEDSRAGHILIVKTESGDKNQQQGTEFRMQEQETKFLGQEQRFAPEDSRAVETRR
jgi:hypothetical protein